MNDLQHFVQNGKKIIGVTANYKSLIKILGRTIPEVPEIFLKPTSSYITEGKSIQIPIGFSVNQEIELGVIIGTKGKKIPESEAMNHIGGYCAALDMTATCKMQEARSKGGSWTLGKGFDTACPVSKFIPKELVKDPHNLNVWSKVNGEMRQNANTNDLIFTIPFLISWISQHITLEVNDLIITGSPPGMGPVKPGDTIEAGIENLVKMKYSVNESV